ncbi:hypothetical protein D3C81_1517480 [compost metagenome]
MVAPVNRQHPSSTVSKPMWLPWRWPMTWTPLLSVAVSIKTGLNACRTTLHLTPPPSSSWCAKAIQSRFMTGTIWLNRVCQSLRQTRKAPAAHAGTIWRHGVMPCTTITTIRPKLRTSSKLCLKTWKCWIPARAALPIPLLNAELAMC